uniref:BPTI/Kunitz inhibitor domain-containing protein n=1 Tax=Capra hircus TaxID=9925 RepID=A0A8C2R9V0_CAPHI
MEMLRLCFSAVLLFPLGTILASIPGGETSNQAQNLWPDLCLEPPNMGPCKAKIIRYFYKAGSGFLETFVFGSCKAKNNSVEIREVCPRYMVTMLNALGPGE